MRICLFALVLSLFVVSAIGQDSTSTCPPPTQSKGPMCVLDADVTLDATLQMDSSTHLNCEGHKLLPNSIGSGGTPSQPEVAFLLNKVFGVKIENCTIGDADRGFDFGVVVMNTKTPPKAKRESGPKAQSGNKILSNTIASRVQGVVLIGADDTQISDNEITYGSGAGSGITVMRDSDDNKIANNTIRSPGKPFGFARQLPGADLTSLCPDCGIVIVDPPYEGVFNVIVGGTLVQFPNRAGSANDDNVIEENIISLRGESTDKSHFAIAVGARSNGTTVRENTVMSAGVGLVAAGLRADLLGTMPGQCSLDPTRWCSSNADCQIPGVDPTSKGMCTGPQREKIDARATYTTLFKNTLVGPFSNGLAVSGGSTSFLTVEQNTIVGRGVEGGIALFSEALENATVSRNVVTDAYVGLFLDHTSIGSSDIRPAQYFGARISLNDMTGSVVRAIDTTKGYLFPTELSVELRGNYWGHSCSEGGFLSTDSPDVRLIRDSYPYGVPVAATPRGQLPSTCR